LLIDTEDQLADLFTKLLSKERFEKLRNLIQGVDWRGTYPHHQTRECEVDRDL